MSDRTTANLLIWRATDDELARIVAAIEDELGAFDEDLEVGSTVYMSEAPLDAHDTIAAAIIETAPDAVFVVWVDPKYEYCGLMVQYAPGLGRFECQTNAEGEELFGRTAVVEILALPEPDRDRALGLPWARVMAGCREAIAA